MAGDSRKRREKELRQFSLMGTDMLDDTDEMASGVLLLGSEVRRWERNWRL